MHKKIFIYYLIFQGDCSIWRPIPPNDDYVAMGDISIPDLSKTEPPVEMVVCVHKKFVKQTRAHQIPSNISNNDNGYLWCSKGAFPNHNWSVWLVEPALDGILCNTFFATNGNSYPDDHSQANCLKLCA